MKRCSKCKIEKSLNEFYNAKSFKDGKTYECKQCMSEYRKKNKDKNIEYQKKRRKTINDKVCKQRRNSYRNTDPKKKVLQNIKYRAKTRNIEYNITEQDLILPKECPYLKKSFVIGVKDNYEYTHSIDRIDNSKGYIPGNVEIISKKANSMKNNASNEELINFALEIIKRNKDNDIVRTMLKNIELEDKELLG